MTPDDKASLVAQTETAATLIDAAVTALSSTIDLNVLPALRDLTKATKVLGRVTQTLKEQ